MQRKQEKMQLTKELRTTWLKYSELRLSVVVDCAWLFICTSLQKLGHIPSKLNLVKLYEYFHILNICCFIICQIMIYNGFSLSLSQEREQIYLHNLSDVTCQSFSLTNQSAPVRNGAARQVWTAGETLARKWNFPAFIGHGLGLKIHFHVIIKRITIRRYLDLNNAVYSQWRRLGCFVEVDIIAF